jgi:sarcosine oxidase gamma subunit
LEKYGVGIAIQAISKASLLLTLENYEDRNGYKVYIWNTFASYLKIQGEDS